MNIEALTTALALPTFQAIIVDVLPLVGTAVMVGFLFYVIRWAISLFRGI